MSTARPDIALFCGGFGGARFAPGLAAAARGRDLTVVTNPGDDADFVGLEVWPDFDSVLYGLAGRFDEVQGWGLQDDTYRCHAALGAEGWFRMGDADVAHSLLRTTWLRAGRDRSSVARGLREHLGVATCVVPSAAGSHRTRVQTTVDGADRVLDFQEFVVRLRGQGVPRGVRIDPRSDRATDEALQAASAGVVVLGPSNPIFSLMPILSTPGIVPALQAAGTVVAVSPVIAGSAPRTDPERGRFHVRGQAMELLGLPHTAAGAAAFLGGLIDGFVLDHHDRADAEAIRSAHGIPVLTTELRPVTAAAREALAREVLDFGAGLTRARADRAPSGVLARFLGDR